MEPTTGRDPTGQVAVPVSMAAADGSYEASPPQWTSAAAVWSSENGLGGIVLIPRRARPGAAAAGPRIVGQLLRRRSGRRHADDTVASTCSLPSALAASGLWDSAPTWCWRAIRRPTTFILPGHTAALGRSCRAVSAKEPASEASSTKGATKRGGWPLVHQWPATCRGAGLPTDTACTDDTGQARQPART